MDGSSKEEGQEEGVCEEGEGEEGSKEKEKGTSEESQEKGREEEKKEIALANHADTFRSKAMFRLRPDLREV